MPWKECDRVSLRMELLRLTAQEGANVSELCRRFGISRKTAYKWRTRLAREGPAGLTDRSRRPVRCPGRTSADVEAAVLAVRERHPAWGGRKIRKRLLTLGHRQVPAASTITEILRRHGRIDEADSLQHKPLQRFERSAPNELWQMDFKGDFALASGGRCYPLTVLDDHSRYSIGLQACGNQQYPTVRRQLTGILRHYGLPQAILMDNGTPWGVPHEFGAGYTRLTLWLLRLHVRVIHSRPRHPQTHGKEERFHRTLKVELLREAWYRNLREAQSAFDPWRQMYNFERPHEALDLEVPASRYRPSDRPMPDRLPPLEYGPGVLTRAVSRSGQVQLDGRVLKVSEAFHGHRIGLRPLRTDGVYEILYGAFPVGEADLRGTRRGRTAEVRLRSLRSLQRTSAAPVVP